ncbi:programmed cell death 1 ligand 1-like isoform 1-T1 [Menidia menidia]
MFEEKRGKMVFTIQLVLILTSSVCASEFVVNVARNFYQAEENHNVTLEWTFTAQPSSSNKTLFIYCEHLTQNSLSVIFHIFKGVEASLYQDTRFVGRVQSDKDALRNGRIRLHLSNVTTEDSGVYKCQVNTEYGWGSDSFQLNVTEAAHEAQTQGPAVRSPPSSEGNFFLYVVVGVVALGVVLLVIIGVITRCIQKLSKSSPKSVNEKNCQQPLRQQSEPSHPHLKA